MALCARICHQCSNTGNIPQKQFLPAIASPADRSLCEYERNLLYYEVYIHFSSRCRQRVSYSRESQHIQRSFPSLKDRPGWQTIQDWYPEAVRMRAELLF